MDQTSITNAVANGDSTILTSLIAIGSFCLTWYIYEQVKKFITTKKKRFF